MTDATCYSHRFRLPYDRREVFDLFADPHALDRLTPSWFRLHPASDLPEDLGAGSEITYRFRWRGLPLPWTSRLTDWDAPRFLAYEQRRGPYRYFRHEHFFEPVDGGTEVLDRVYFRSPGGRLFDRLIATPDLKRIFACRERKALALLGAERAA